MDHTADMGIKDGRHPVEFYMRSRIYSTSNVSEPRDERGDLALGPSLKTYKLKNPWIQSLVGLLRTSKLIMGARHLDFIMDWWVGESVGRNS